MACSSTIRFGPAYEHEGYAAGVLDDGTDTGTWTAAIGARVSGWRAAYDCGWRGGQFYSRAEWPSELGVAPDAVEGWEAGAGRYAEWDAHLAVALPALAIHDLTLRIAEAQEELERAVARARAAGESWSSIGAAAGVTRQSAHERWGSRATLVEPFK